MKGLQGFEPAPQTDRLIPFHAGYNRSNPSFFQITNRFDRTHAPACRTRRDKPQVKCLPGRRDGRSQRQRDHDRENRPWRDGGTFLEAGRDVFGMLERGSVEAISDLEE